ncbi:hypothetical protein ElyMa_005597900 [Elysia marginata]|uniref:Uncharacterized protein n=1 Tax=Elysia marginata TaxID=1093978 RepID=A0AAV4F6K8_9GAST|nr:hypothetical protein ElyMa_005597900 [Elysia marginata]
MLLFRDRLKKEGQKKTGPQATSTPVQATSTPTRAAQRQLDKQQAEKREKAWLRQAKRRAAIKPNFFKSIVGRKRSAEPDMLHQSQPSLFRIHRQKNVSFHWQEYSRG